MLYPTLRDSPIICLAISRPLTLFLDASMAVAGKEVSRNRSSKMKDQKVDVIRGGQGQLFFSCGHAVRHRSDLFFFAFLGNGRLCFLEKQNVHTFAGARVQSLCPFRTVATHPCLGHKTSTMHRELPNARRLG